MPRPLTADPMQTKPLPIISSPRAKSCAVASLEEKRVRCRLAQRWPSRRLREQSHRGEDNGLVSRRCPGGIGGEWLPASVSERRNVPIGEGPDAEA